MIEVQVITKMSFSNDEDLDKYLASDEQASITGFAEEVREARASGKPLQVKTNRPEHGTVTVSEIRVVTDAHELAFCWRCGNPCGKAKVDKEGKRLNAAYGCGKCDEESPKERKKR